MEGDSKGDASLKMNGIRRKKFILRTYVSVIEGEGVDESSAKKRKKKGKGVSE